jgi:hypothetical protein
MIPITVILVTIILIMRTPIAITMIRIIVITKQ